MVIPNGTILAFGTCLAITAMPGWKPLILPSSGRWPSGNIQTTPFCSRILSIIRTASKSPVFLLIVIAPVIRCSNRSPKRFSPSFLTTSLTSLGWGPWVPKGPSKTCRWFPIRRTPPDDGMFSAPMILAPNLQHRYRAIIRPTSGNSERILTSPLIIASNSR